MKMTNGQLPFLGSLFGLARFTVSVPLLLALVACVTPTSDAAALQRAIAEVPGVYRIEADGARARYSSLARLNEIVSHKPPETALRELIDCLDDTTPSRSTYAGKAVPVGVICYEAISVLAYHEPVDADGDIAPHWPGDVPPTATVEELQAAERAWRRVLKDKTYIFL